MILRLSQTIRKSFLIRLHVSATALLVLTNGAKSQYLTKAITMYERHIDSYNKVEQSVDAATKVYKAGIAVDNLNHQTTTSSSVPESAATIRSRAEAQVDVILTTAAIAPQGVKINPIEAFERGRDVIVENQVQAMKSAYLANTTITDPGTISQIMRDYEEDRVNQLYNGVSAPLSRSLDSEAETFLYRQLMNAKSSISSWMPLTKDDIADAILNAFGKKDEYERDYIAIKRMIGAPPPYEYNISSKYTPPQLRPGRDQRGSPFRQPNDSSGAAMMGIIGPMMLQGALGAIGNRGVAGNGMVRGGGRGMGCTSPNGVAWWCMR